MPDLRGDVRHGRTGAYDMRSLAPWVTLLLVLLLVAAATALTPKARAAAPDFQVTSTGVEDGAWQGPVAFALSDYRGRTVVLDFMAVACTPCRAVTNETLKPIWAEFGGRPDFAMLSIDTWADPEVPGWQTRERLARLQNETGVPWRHALDTDRAWSKHDAVALPKVVVVDRWGRIAYASEGEVDTDSVAAAVHGLMT